MAFGGIGIRGIVIDAQVIDEWQESDEVLAAAGPAFADFFLGNVVTAVGHAAAHAAEMQFGAGQPAEPNVEAMAGLCGAFEQLRDGASTECRLKAVVSALRDRLL